MQCGGRWLIWPVWLRSCWEEEGALEAAVRAWLGLVCCDDAIAAADEVLYYCLRIDVNSSLGMCDAMLCRRGLRACRGHYLRVLLVSLLVELCAHFAGPQSFSNSEDLDVGL